MSMVDNDAHLGRRFITPEGVDLNLRLGSAGERAGAFLLDALIISVILTILSIFAAFIFLKISSDAYVDVVFSIILLGTFLYFVIFEITPRAATPGKIVLGLRVISRDGGRLTGEAIFVRNAMREIEVFLPLGFIISSPFVHDQIDGIVVLLGLLWTGIFMLFPLFNRDRLRVGDFVAGTWVVKAPRRRLAVDLAHDAADRLSRFNFSADQTGAYGVKELQVLEDVLRRRDRKTMFAVASRIRGKIAWRETPNESDADFLAAYYAALRSHLEKRLLFGHRRKDKFDRA